jgi:hypothetical protein
MMAGDMSDYYDYAMPKHCSKQSGAACLNCIEFVCRKYNDCCNCTAATARVPDIGIAKAVQGLGSKLK